MVTRARKKPGPPPSKREPLSQERILSVALALIERDGLEAFSLRSLGRELGVEAMSVYHWFPSRLHLLNALLDRVVAEIQVPIEGDWLERVRRAAWSFRAAGHRSPRFFPFVLVHRFNTETSLALLERVLVALRASGHDAETVARMFRAWIHVLMGALSDELAGYSRGPGATDPMAPEELERRFPAVAALGPFNDAAHHEENFRFALEAMLGAFERIPRRKGSA